MSPGRALHKPQAPWADMPPAGREALLWKLADLIEQNAAEFAEIESLDKDEISPRDLKKIRAYVIHRANEDKKFEAAER